MNDALDAKRYRWLRDLDVDDSRCYIGNLPGNDWDAVIDREMAEEASPVRVVADTPGAN